MLPFTRHSRTAFTLVELLVALGIIIVLTVIAVPVIEPMLKTKSVDAAANMIRSALAHARNSAVAEAQEAICWFAPGSVFEAGTVAPPPPSSPVPIDIIIDNNDTTQKSDPLGYWTAKFTAQGTWTTHTVGGYGGTFLRAISGGGGTNMATWQFWLKRRARLKVSVRFYYYVDNATVGFKIYSTKTYTGTIPDLGIPDDTHWRNQAVSGDAEKWLAATGATSPTGEYDFPAGERAVSVSDYGATPTRGIVADAIRLEGTIPAETLNPNECLILVPSGKTYTTSQVPIGQTYTSNRWNDYYIVISNRAGGSIGSTGASIVGRITSIVHTVGEYAAKVTVSAPWSPNTPPANSRYLIVQEDPRVTQVSSTSTIGSGTDVTMRWDALPQNIEVVQAGAVFPVSFSPTGRARFANDSGAESLTIQVRDKERPDNPDYHRYVRVYKNTGRAVVARRIEDLP